MGFFGLFRKGDGGLKKHAARAANKRAQAQDRWESIEALGKMATEASIEALLRRFEFRVDPSITDQDEKAAALEWVVKAGEAAVGPAKRFLWKADSVAWPMRCLVRLVPEEQVTTELVALLAGMDTEYERDPEKKIQVLSALEERRHPSILDTVQPFLGDVNETVRFHAAATALAQVDDETPAETAAELRAALLEAFGREESVRVRSRILDGFIDLGWDVGDQAADVQGKLPAGYALDTKGHPRK